MSTATAAQMTQRFKYLILLSLTHGVIDLNTGAIVTLLPTLRAHYALNYTLVGSITLATQITSSLTQPIFGALSDRTAGRWLLPSSLLLAGVGVAALGYMPGFGLILSAAVLSALGIAAFHPEGAHGAHRLATGQRVQAMATFNVGGNLGYGLSPIYVSAILALGGMRATWIALILPLLLAGFLVREMPAWQRFEATLPRPSARQLDQRPATHWWGLSLLTAFSMLRSMIQTGIITFLPFYWIDRLGHSAGSSRYLLLLYLMAGVVGTLIGAPLADRIGNKPLLVGSFALLLVFQVLLMYVQGWLFLACLAATGFLVVATATVTLVMSQDYAPRQLGLASGLNLGLAFGFGGVASLALGVVADHYGLGAVLKTLAALIPLALLVAALLPPLPAAAD